MNKLAIVLASSVVLAAPLAWGDNHRDDFDRDQDRDQGAAEYAQVVSADPVEHLVRVNDSGEECREEPVTERVAYPRRYYNPGATILGAIIGGVIGHQFGGGVGNSVATAAGAVIGASAGAQHSGYAGERVAERTRYASTCGPGYPTHLEHRVVGYEVVYRWHGREYHTRMDHDPGSQLPVRVDVAPVEDDNDNN